MSDRKKKSLAKLVASKQVDKNVHKFSLAIQEEGEKNCFSTCQSDSSQIDNYKHSRHNIDHLKCSVENENLDHYTDIKILNKRFDYNRSPTASKNTLSKNKNDFPSEDKVQHGKKIIAVNQKNRQDITSDVNNVYPILRLKSQNTNENSSITTKESNDNMESEFKPSLNSILACDNPRLIRPKAESLPPIEHMAQDSYSYPSPLNDNSSNQTYSTSPERKLSGKEKLFKIHGQDEIAIDESLNEENSTEINKVQKKPERQISTDSVSSPTKSASESNLSRNHSLKYSGGALHDDRNPLSFDHTFPQVNQNVSQPREQCKNTLKKIKTCLSGK